MADNVLTRPVAQKGQRKQKRRRRLTPYWFLLPAALLLLVLIGLPLMYAFGLSFYRYQWNAPYLGITFVGLDNYRNLVRDQPLISSVGWTVSFTAIVVAVELVLGLGLALLLQSRHLGRARSLLRGVFLVPMMLSGVVAGFMWRLLFDPEYGPINHLLGLVGMEPVRWFTESTPTRLVVILSDVWLSTPFVILVLLAGVQSIGEEFYEAARIDGASPWQLFRHITLPLLQYPILVVLIIRTMDALRAFDQIYVLTRGGPGVSTATVMMYNYRYAFNFYQMGRASAVSFAALVVIALISAGYLWVVRRNEAS